MPNDTDTLIADARARHGFLTPHALGVIAADPHSRLMPVLVRCGGCRFSTPAQDAQHLIDIIGRDKQDYVRDVSLL